MAKSAGINMMECTLIEENNRAHFLTKRFDRTNNQKIHTQSLCGLAHYDYNMAGAYSYEQAFSVMRKLQLEKPIIKQQFRRMVFNVVARNQDDHTKNIAYTMDKIGTWQLSPAFDITYSHNPHGKWTNQHQMSINGKRDDFNYQDLITVGESIGINKPDKIIHEIIDVVLNWPRFAKQSGLNKKITDNIGKYHRTKKLLR